MEPGIYLELTPAQSSGINLWDDKHAYLVYRKANGDTEVIRGGPGFRSASRGRNGGLAIQAEVGKSLYQSQDKYEAGERPDSRPSRRLDIAAADLDKVWMRMRRKAEEIGAAGLSYRADTEPDDPDQTSNSVVRAALRRAAAAWGRPGVEEGLALGRFDGFVRNAEAGGLRTAAKTAFAPLFPASTARPGGPRPEGYGLQMAVNDLGQEMMGRNLPALERGRGYRAQDGSRLP
ncbi:hypothetical protein RJ527_09275 [Thalassospiraceae bacterium LMO-SO8]|nr:hypothetical protein [Alphaproteobacteria bacterium LMO-S08]WND77923.1 hypothetical protein RJ527_09275 [Thalassospiraceae bacterium LMO-SO8]